MRALVLSAVLLLSLMVGPGCGSGAGNDPTAVLRRSPSGQYLNDDVRGFAQSQISQAEAAGQAVASPKDLQVQVEQLTQLVEGIAARMNEPARKGFWQRVFGN